MNDLIEIVEHIDDNGVVYKRTANSVPIQRDYQPSYWIYKQDKSDHRRRVYYINKEQAEALNKPFGN